MPIILKTGILFLAKSVFSKSQGWSRLFSQTHELFLPVKIWSMHTCLHVHLRAWTPGVIMSKAELRDRELGVLPLVWTHGPWDRRLSSFLNTHFLRWYFAVFKSVTRNTIDLFLEPSLSLIMLFRSVFFGPRHLFNQAKRPYEGLRCYVPQKSVKTEFLVRLCCWPSLMKGPFTLHSLFTHLDLLPTER